MPRATYNLDGKLGRGISFPQSLSGQGGEAQSDKEHLSHSVHLGNIGFHRLYLLTKRSILDGMRKVPQWLRWWRFASRCSRGGAAGREDCINERAPTQLVVNANGFFPMITFAGSGEYLGDRVLAGGSRSPSVCPRSLYVVPDSLVLLSLLAGCCEERLLPMVLPQCVPMNHVDKCLMTETPKLGGKRQAKSFCLWSCFSQVFCYSYEAMTITNRCTSLWSRLYNSKYV